MSEPEDHRDRVKVDDEFQLLGRLGSGRAMLGQTQFLPGYCLLLCDARGADRLTDLPRRDRIAFLVDMEALGEAVERVCRRRDSAFRRINLEIQGNLTPRLHAHIWPRYDWEPPDIKIHQVARHPFERWHDPRTMLGPQHLELRNELRTELARVIDQKHDLDSE